MRYKLLLSLIVTILIFVFIFIRIDMGSFTGYLLTINPIIFVIAMLFTALTVTLNGIRWKYLISKHCEIGVWKSIKLTLLGLSFNIVTPSRLGDFTKAHYLKKDRLMDFKSGSSSIVFEKGLDTLCLSVLSIIGIIAMGLSNFYVLILIPVIILVVIFKIGYLKRVGFIMRRKTLGGIVLSFCDFFEGVRRDRKMFLITLGMTFLLWGLSLMQVYLFFLCFGLSPNMLSIFGLVPLAILVGMIPITIIGMGTRDSAMIFLFPNIPSPIVLGVAFFMTLRYILSAIAGLPTTREYLQKF